MSKHCPSTTRQHAERTARSLRALEVCAGADVLDPNEGPRDEWTIEATLTDTTASADVVQVLADTDCGVVSVSLRAPAVLQLIAAV